MELKWENILSTGVSSIDSEQKELFNRINLFTASMKKGKEEAIKSLDLLQEYVIKYFEEEEELQKKYNYPKLSMQHKQHEVFKTELIQLRKVFENTGVSALFVINSQQKVIKWWEIHTNVLDKEWGVFLQEKTNNK